jgi:hypothetical protein
MKERNAMVGFKVIAAGIAMAAGCVTIVDAETLTIATVNNDARSAPMKPPFGARRAG